MKRFCPLVIPALGLLCTAIPMAAAVEPIPERLVVLTFDDSSRSHFTVARPILKKYEFGATFFVTEGLTYRENPAAYMTWDEIRTLHDDGFEIGNHLKNHMGVNSQNVGQLEDELDWIDERCAEHGITKPVSFAWPGCFWHENALSVLDDHGLLWSRRCSFPEVRPGVDLNIAYDPEHDHPHLIPTTFMGRPQLELKDFRKAMNAPKPGEIAMICFHGVPETEHPWVHTPQDRFEEFMSWLHDEQHTVIAMRDLKKYVEPAKRPGDPRAIINQRKKDLAKRYDADKPHGP